MCECNEIGCGSMKILLHNESLKILFNVKKMKIGRLVK